MSKRDKESLDFLIYQQWNFRFFSDEKENGIITKSKTRSDEKKYGLKKEKKETERDRWIKRKIWKFKFFHWNGMKN